VRLLIINFVLCSVLICAIFAGGLEAGVNPYDMQIDEQVDLLWDQDASVRSGAAESLGYLRAYKATDALERALKDLSAKVRRDAAMSLGWCGGRKQVGSLLYALDDGDWTVRQGAWVALANLTGMEWPFDGLANKAKRQSQIKKWRVWWASVQPDKIPDEGQPVVARHHTHLSKKGEAWKNHIGTHARVLGTVPLAADGSFFVNIPADRLIHFQVLDSDRRVVGNQQIWMYARPEETRGCVGCHEKPDATAYMKNGLFPQAAKTAPIDCLPTGGEFSYRAKFWNKGTLTDEGEERTRTVRAVNLISR